MRFLLEEDDDKSSLKTWQVWSFFTVGVLIILFVVAFMLKWRRRKGKEVEFGDQEVGEEVIMKQQERRSELEFFVEQAEWFKLEDLLEGAADLRSQGFCSSMYVVRLNHGVVYAVKRLRKLKVSFEEFGLTMRMVGKLRHPNLLPLVCYSNTLEEKLLIYRFQKNGSLLNLFESYVQGKRAFPWRLRLSIAVGIAKGLDFIHHQEEFMPFHGIIKPSNIMLGEDDEPLISEYGYVKFLNTTPPMKGYAAPEKTPAQKADVYSFGVILLELLTGKFVEKSGVDLPRWVRSIVREEWTGEVFDKELSEVEMYSFPLLNVSLKCVTHSSDERPSITEVLHNIEEVVRAQQDA